MEIKWVCIVFAIMVIAITMSERSKMYRDVEFAKAGLVQKQTTSGIIWVKPENQKPEEEK
jgi:hypothetical protein